MSAKNEARSRRKADAIRGCAAIEFPTCARACASERASAYNTSARGKARSMESGIIADVDWLKESTGGDPLPYLCNERATVVSRVFDRIFEERKKESFK